MQQNTDNMEKPKTSLTIEIPKFTVSFDDVDEDIPGKKKRVRPEENNELKHTKSKKAKNAGVHS